MTPAVRGPVATVIAIWPAAVILNGVDWQVGTTTASKPRAALPVAVKMALPAPPADTPMATVAAPAAVTAAVELTFPPNTTALSGMVSLLAGVQEAPPSTE